MIKNELCHIKNKYRFFILIEWKDTYNHFRNTFLEMDGILMPRKILVVINQYGNHMIVLIQWLLNVNIMIT